MQPVTSRLGFGLALLLAASVHAQTSPRRKATAFAADLTPAFDYLRERGITNLEGLEQAYGNIEAMFRPVPSEAAAQLVPWGFNNIHIPWAMRGDVVPAAARRPGMQLGARYVNLGDYDSALFVNAGIMVHEIAHGEYAFYKHGGRDGRTERQHQLMARLRDHLVEEGGISKFKWPMIQANEMAAYYIETSVHEVMQRIESVFLVNRFRVNDIKSRAEREALVQEDGRETLLIPMDSPTIKALYEKPAWLVGGQKGDAYFEAEPIDAEIPEAWRKEFYVEILGLGLPQTGDEYIAIAKALKGSWAAEQHAKIKQSRDRRVERIEAGNAATNQAAPSTDGLTRTEGAAAAPVEIDGPDEVEAATLARVEAGTGWAKPPLSLMRHRGSAPRE